MLEEQVFYPAIRDALEADMMNEAQVEHDSAKALILSLQNAKPSDEYYDAKVSVLKEQVEHHVYEEERQRGSMFARVRKADFDLDALGEKMAKLKAQLQAQAKDGGLPRPEPVAILSLISAASGTDGRRRLGAGHGATAGFGAQPARSGRSGRHDLGDGGKLHRRLSCLAADRYRGVEPLSGTGGSSPIPRPPNIRCWGLAPT